MTKNYELQIDQWLSEATNDIVNVINAHDVVILEKGTTGNGGTTFFAENKFYNKKTLVFEPLARTRASKANDSRYHCINGDKAPFKIDYGRCNITTCAKGEKYYKSANASYEYLHNMLWVFDEIDSIFDTGAMRKLFDKLRGYVKNGNKIILMTAYLSDVVKNFITERFHNLAYIKVDVKNNGYSNVNTYLTNSAALKNLDFICPIENLIFFTNTVNYFKDLLKTYNNTKFQLICGDKFKSKLSEKMDGYERIIFVDDTLNIDTKLPIVFTSTIKNGGDIIFSDPAISWSKTFIIDYQNLMGNNDVCQVIGRIRQKDCIKDIYVFERNSKVKKIDYDNIRNYDEPINGDYSKRLNGCVAPWIDFENNRKFDRENISLHTALTKGSYYNYHHFDVNKKGVYVVSKTYLDYLKYLQGCKEFKIVNNVCTDPKLEKQSRQILWKDYKLNLTGLYLRIQNDYEKIFKKIDWDVKVNYKKVLGNDDNDFDLAFDDDNINVSDIPNNEIQRREKIKRILCRAMMDTLILWLDGTVLRKYKEVRWYNSFTALPHDLRPKFLEKYGLYEYDIKTCNPYLLSIITNQHKELFNSHDFDFYDYFSGDTERKEFKTIFNAGLNGMYLYEDLNERLKTWMERFQFEPLLYFFLKSFVEKPGMFFRIMASFEDAVMKELIKKTYELHKGINIERLHDGMITTQKLNNVHKYSVNGYNLTLTGDSWSNDKDKDVSIIFHRITLKTYNFYTTKNIYETCDLFNAETYQAYLEKQTEINKTRKMVGQMSAALAGKAGGGHNKVTMFVDKHGNNITRDEIARIHNITINDPHFNERAQRYGYRKC
jgi:hypothetical protein